MYQIRLATEDDVPRIIGLIDQASEWLKTKDTDQWARPWPSLAERDNRVKRGVADRVTWVVEDHGVLVATASCRADSHSGLWDHIGTEEPAGYMTRLVINRDYAGRNVGHELTDWVGAWARAQFGAKVLRIDVWTTNVRLHSYYEKRGFVFAGFSAPRESPDYPSAAMFYKPTEAIGALAGSLFALTPGTAAPANSPPPPPLTEDPGNRELTASNDADADRRHRIKADPDNTGHRPIAHRLRAPQPERSRRCGSNREPAIRDHEHVPDEKSGQFPIPSKGIKLLMGFAQIATLVHFSRSSDNGPAQG
jgi:GNAT superfamily N-acetyltransferase